MHGFRTSVFVPIDPRRASGTNNNWPSKANKPPTIATTQVPRGPYFDAIVAPNAGPNNIPTPICMPPRRAAVLAIFVRSWA